MARLFTCTQAHTHALAITLTRAHEHELWTLKIEMVNCTTVISYIDCGIENSVVVTPFTVVGWFGVGLKWSYIYTILVTPVKITHVVI